VRGFIIAVTETLLTADPVAVVVQSKVARPSTPSSSGHTDWNELGDEKNGDVVRVTLPGGVMTCVQPLGGKGPSSKSRHW
jgi:hypothetical protein